jgi:hypothetical protein
MQLQKNLSTEDRLKKQKTPNRKDFGKSCSYYYVTLLLLMSVVFLSGCVGTMPSSLEVAAHGVKTVYNKCSDLDRWNCLWYDKSY